MLNLKHACMIVLMQQTDMSTPEILHLLTYLLERNQYSKAIMTITARSPGNAGRT